MKRVLLLDGDVVAYIISAQAETRLDWGDGDSPTYTVNKSGAESSCKKWVEDTLKRLDADEVIVALGNKPYFRSALWPAYKLHRTAGRPPELLPHVKDYLKSNYKTYIRPALEADDVLGILATHPTAVEGEKVVVSSDKDLKQIPGKHWNPMKPREPVVEVSPEQGDYFFYYQTLVGDQCDGYPGCPGVGPVKAKRILQKEDRTDPVWRDVERAYTFRGKQPEDALTQARVARILRWTDWDYTKKEVKLWTPN